MIKLRYDGDEPVWVIIAAVLSLGLNLLLGYIIIIFLSNVIQGTIVETYTQIKEYDLTYETRKIEESVQITKDSTIIVQPNIQ